MEKELFDWENWDLLDTMAFCYYDCKLKVPIGDYPIGTLIRTIEMDYENSTMNFSDDDGNNLGHFKLKLQIEAIAPLQPAAV